jgi:hypothetical protein
LSLPALLLASTIFDGMPARPLIHYLLAGQAILAALSQQGREV